MITTSSNKENKNTVIFSPECRLAKIVEFKNDRCPFSGHKNCKECLATNQDVQCLIYLRDANPNDFGLA